MRRVFLLIFVFTLANFFCSKTTHEKEFLLRNGSEIKVGKLTLKIPEGALDREVRIKVKEVKDVPKGNIAPAYKIEPDLTFRKPIEIWIEGEGALAYVEGGEWVPIATWHEREGYQRQGHCIFLCGV